MKDIYIVFHKCQKRNRCSNNISPEKFLFLFLFLFLSWSICSAFRLFLHTDFANRFCVFACVRELVRCKVSVIHPFFPLISLSLSSYSDKEENTKKKKKKLRDSCPDMPLFYKLIGISMYSSFQNSEYAPVPNYRVPPQIAIHSGSPSMLGFRVSRNLNG